MFIGKKLEIRAKGGEKLGRPNPDWGKRKFSKGDVKTTFS